MVQFGYALQLLTYIYESMIFHDHHHSLWYHRQQQAAWYSLKIFIDHKE